MFEAGGWGWNGESGELYRSTDRGQTWDEVSLPDKIEIDYRASAILDLNTAWLAIIDQQNTRQLLLHTEDGGRTWKEITPQDLESMAGYFSYHFVNSKEGWVEASDAGAGNLYIEVFETLNGGESYQVVPIVRLPAENGLPRAALRLCNICGDILYFDPARIVIITGDMGSMEPRGTLIGKVSFDRGGSWEEINVPLPEKYKDALVWPLQAAFVSDTEGFQPVLLTQFNPDGSRSYRVMAVYASRDGGASWSLAPGLVEGVAEFPRVQFLNSRDAMAQCGAAICVTHDGAKTWEAFPLDPTMVPDESLSIMQIQYVDPLTAWMVIGRFAGSSTSYSIYKTTDGAASWRKQ